MIGVLAAIFGTYIGAALVVEALYRHGRKAPPEKWSRCGVCDSEDLAWDGVGDNALYHCNDCSSRGGPGELKAARLDMIERSHEMAISIRWVEVLDSLCEAAPILMQRDTSRHYGATLDSEELRAWRAVEQAVVHLSVSSLTPPFASTEPALNRLLQAIHESDDARHHVGIGTTSYPGWSSDDMALSRRILDELQPSLVRLLLTGISRGNLAPRECLRLDWLDAPARGELLAGLVLAERACPDEELSNLVAKLGTDIPAEAAHTVLAVLLERASPPRSAALLALLTVDDAVFAETLSPVLVASNDRSVRSALSQLRGPPIVWYADALAILEARWERAAGGLQLALADDAGELSAVTERTEGELSTLYD